MSASGGLKENQMRKFSTDLQISNAHEIEVTQQRESGFTIPIIILLLCLTPDIPGLGDLKLPIAVILLFLTLPAVLAAFANKIRIAGSGIFLVLLLITVLNIFNVLAYHGPFLRWLRMAFCPYMFAAAFFYIAYKIKQLI